MQYKGEAKILILNSPEEFNNNIFEISSSIKVYSDYRKINESDKFGFVLIFVKNCADVVKFSEFAKNNLIDDGNLWFSYPKKSSKKYNSDISRDIGWQPICDMGFKGVRAVSVDDDWSALRFRDVKYIKNLMLDKSIIMAEERTLKK